MMNSDVPIPKAAMASAASGGLVRMFPDLVFAGWAIWKRASIVQLQHSAVKIGNGLDGEWSRGQAAS